MTFDFILLQAMEDAVICILGRSVGWPGSWRLGSAQCWNQGDPFNDYWNSPDETIKTKAVEWEYEGTDETSC